MASTTVANPAESCILCNTVFNAAKNRKITELCGHSMCRSCVIKSESSCIMCSKIMPPPAIEEVSPRPVLKQYPPKQKRHEAGPSGSPQGESQVAISATPARGIKLPTKQSKSSKCPSSSSPPSINQGAVKDVYVSEIHAEEIIFPNLLPDNENVKVSFFNDLTDTEISKKDRSMRQLQESSVPNYQEITFSCVYCNKIFTEMTTLSKHIIIVHTGEQPYACSHCGRRFSFEWTLDLHMKLHSNEGPYVCDKCPTEFSNSIDLRSHLATHKKGRRPLKCWVCGVAFNRKESLDKHLRNKHKLSGDVIAEQLSD